MFQPSDTVVLYLKKECQLTIVLSYNIIVYIMGQKFNRIYEHKIVSMFLPISFNIFLCPQKNHLIETVLLSTTKHVLAEK